MLTSLTDNRILKLRYKQLPDLVRIPPSRRNISTYFYSQEMAYKWRTSLYLAASASAEFFADILLCPFEACKVRIQTQPGWARTLREGMPKLHGEEGIAGFVVSSHWQI